MKILFTGGSSFTGYWFIRQLAAAGLEIVATFGAGGVEQYDELRARRVEKCLQACTPVWNCRFGDDKFLEVIAAQGGWDQLCHHGAYVKDYKSLDFDTLAAVRSNALNLQQVLQALQDKGSNRVVLTGSVFEQNEGAGSLPLHAFSPYGLSKGLTAQVFEYWCQHFEIGLSKFVIPNPFGPFEEKRFTAYLVNNWLAGNTPSVNTPDYVRDNIHVSLLARAYCNFAEEADDSHELRRLNPSGYTESQGEFAMRLAGEMRSRLDRPCELELATQVDFSEPLERINTDKSCLESIDWKESEAWDGLAEYYLASQKK